MKRVLLVSAALHAAAFLGLYVFSGVPRAFDLPGMNLEIVVSPTQAGVLLRANRANRALPDASPATNVASGSADLPPSAPSAGVSTGVSSAAESENAIASAFSRNSVPVYPRVSRLRGEEGRAVVEVTIARDGARVSVPRIKQSSGFEALDRAALAAVESWSFSPLEHSERLDLEVPFVFRLEGKR